MKKLDWLIQAISNKSTEPSIKDSKEEVEYSLELIRTVDEILTEPENAVIFTRRDYYEVLNAAISLLPDVSEKKAQEVIQLTSIVEFGATLPKKGIPPKRHEILSGYKQYVTEVTKGAVSSSELLKLNLESDSGMDYLTVRTLLEKSFAKDIDVDLLKKACKAVREYEDRQLTMEEGKECVN